MRAVGEAVLEAAKLERPVYSGFFISLTGVLTLGARALREMAAPPESDQAVVLAAHEERCSDAQPALHAFGLEELARHIDMMRVAIAEGDLVTVRQMFEVYRIE